MTKRNKIIYWISTVWLALGMVSTGLVQLFQNKEEVELMAQLGYPAYFLIILGVWKLLGAIAVIVPKFPRIKEWAYAGFFFVMTGAIISHLAVGESVINILPALLLVVRTIVSWYFRPIDRKLISVNK